MPSFLPIGLLAAFIAPFIKTFARNDAAPFFEVVAELSLAHPVGADVQQWRTRLPPGAQPVNAEARKDNALLGDKDRHEFRWRDVGIELEIQARSAVKPARDV